MLRNLGILFFSILFAQAPNVVGYDLWLDSLNLPQRWWSWRGGVVFHPQGSSSLSLTLRNYTIDSVRWGSQSLSYTYNDSLLIITLPTGLGVQETVWVYYRGEGVQDPGGFGGVYWGNTYVFNIGVSLSISPHSFGRAWHPCVDTFGNKAYYHYHLRVPDSLAATANGLLDSVRSEGVGWKRWHWRLRYPIPAYLAGVAIGKYVAARDTFIRAPGDTLPIEYWVHPMDSAGTYVTFQRLKTLMRDWEIKFGKYPYERVGFVGTAFNSGAMEHATHVVYPSLLMANTNQYDWLWAHELNHQWFGNSVTGSQESQIFLKEGFATHSEALFYERFFSKTRYYDHIRDFLERTLRVLKWEEGLFPLSNIPPEHTYGIATYRKGATVLNTLRHQLGDSLYFLGMRAYNHRYKHGLVTIDSLQRVLEDTLGVSLQAFFDDWLRTPGEVHFRIDSFGRVGTDSVWIAWRMSLRDKPSYSTPTLLTVYLRGVSPAETLYARFSTDGSMAGIARVACPFTPRIAVLNPNGEVSDATTHGMRWVKVTGNFTLPTTYVTLRAIGLPAGDSLWIHVGHNWVGAYDAAGYPLSNNRYWQLDGSWGASLALRGVFTYNGRAIGTGAYLDTVWLSFTEDSLALYWRPHAGETWREWSYYTVDRGSSATDLQGRIIADTLLPGEYVLGKKMPTTTVYPLSTTSPASFWQVWAAEGSLIVSNRSQREGLYLIFDLLGRLYGRGELDPQQEKVWLLPAGIYVIQTPEGPKRVVVTK
ncbi:MAG: M1 family aminopeptidase [Bacteroidia bacterium]|nr:M1 family aminopeptidase [Bacteroidia bacterium]